MKKRKLLLLSAIVGVAGIIFGILLYYGKLPFRTLACPGQIAQMRFSPDGRFLAASVRGKGIFVWNSQNWHPVQALSGAYDTFYFLPDSRTIIANSIYSTGSGPLAAAVNRGEGLTMAQQKQIDPTLQGRLQRWDFESGSTAKVFILPQSALDDAAPRVDQAVLHRVASQDGLSFLSTADGHEIHFLPASPSAAARLSPDGCWIALVDYIQHTGKVTIWNTQTWQSKTLPAPVGPADADFSPDGQWLEAFSAKNIVLWRVSDWHQAGLFPTNYQNAGRSQFSPDSRQIIADGSWKTTQQGIPNTALMIWDVATGRKTATLRQQELIFWRLTSRGLVTADTDNFSSHLWDTANGHPMWQGCAGYGSETVVSTNGHTMVTAHPRTQNLNEGSMIEVRYLP